MVCAEVPGKHRLPVPIVFHSDTANVWMLIQPTKFLSASNTGSFFFFVLFIPSQEVKAARQPGIHHRDVFSKDELKNHNRRCNKEL